jgi:two-component system chemotaxis response regulator CheB
MVGLCISLISEININKPMQHPKFIIVIGASAGGVTALTKVIEQLPKDLDAAVCIVIHLSDASIDALVLSRLQRHTSLPCMLAQNNASITAGSIYIAPADRHLVIVRDKMIIGHGPKENRWRPSIDILFRSAAVAYGEAVIGIVLSGMLDDGTAGMIAIDACGGTSIIQDPNEAEYPDMPLSVRNNIKVDHSLSLAQMGATITDIIREKQFRGIKAPSEIIAEAAIAARMFTGIDVVRPLAEQSVYTCPDCGGGLWEIAQYGHHRYRCNIGHAYSESDLLRKQSGQLESTLWIALRIMEERNNLLKKMGDQQKKKGLADVYYEDVEVLEGHIKNLKDLLFKTQGERQKVQ